jgi:hypothetical protein
MARPKNTTETVQITISTTQQVKDLLELLSKSGFYGKNAADTAHALLKEKIRDLQREGQAPRPSFAPLPME